jgi:hypothetical protein
MSRLRRSPRLLAVALGAALVLVASGAVVATSFIRSGGALKAMKAITSDTTYGECCPLDWTDVYVASVGSESFAVTMKVPNSTNGLFLATFSGQIEGGGGCRLRLLINSGIMVPGPVTIDDSTEYTMQSMQWIAGPYPAGTYTFKVQHTGLCYLGPRTLSVVRSQS